MQAALGWPHELSRLHEKPVEAASSTPPSLHRGQIQARMSGSAGRDEAKQQKSAWLQHNDGYKQLLEVFRKFVREVILPHLGCDVLFQAVPVLRCVLPGSVAPCQPHVDADYFHDASELNFWLPLTAVAGANSLYSESAPGLGDYAPFDLDYGECMRFYGNRCRHYTVANSTMTTRVSIDFRVIPASLAAPPSDTTRSQWKLADGGYYELMKLEAPEAPPPAAVHDETGAALLAACASGALTGIVREVAAFAAPHEDSTRAALGVAVVCEVGRTVSLAQLRRAAKKAKAPPPELLVLLRALPPSAAGLAEALQLPPLTSQQPTRTLDLRASTSVDGAPDYESSQRAAARKAAAQRAAAGRRNPPPAAAAAVPGDASSLDGCIRLVAAAMAEVGGEAVSEDDDLFEVGLSSVTAAKLRQLLAERLAVDVPPDLVYRFTAVRSLAAALYRLRNDASADDGPQAAPLLVAAASRLYREGDIAGAVDRLEGLMPGSGAATRADARRCCCCSERGARLRSGARRRRRVLRCSRRACGRRASTAHCCGLRSHTSERHSATRRAPPPPRTPPTTRHGRWRRRRRCPLRRPTAASHHCSPRLRLSCRSTARRCRLSCCKGGR